MTPFPALKIVHIGFIAESFFYLKNRFLVLKKKNILEAHHMHVNRLFLNYFEIFKLLKPL